jgi:hypothetical protein
VIAGFTSACSGDVIVVDFPAPFAPGVNLVITDGFGGRFGYCAYAVAFKVNDSAVYHGKLGHVLAVPLGKPIAEEYGCAHDEDKQDDTH